MNIMEKLFPHGIWYKTEEDKQLVAVMYVYLRLKDLPEAKVDLDDCTTKYYTAFRPIFKTWLAGNVDKARRDAHQNYDAWKAYHGLRKTIPLGPDEQEKAERLFQPFVDKWALGSELMAIFCSSVAMADLIRSILGISPRQLRRHPGDTLIHWLSMADEQNGQAWKVLLTGEYTRAEKATRAVQRESQRAQGYNLLEERTMAKWADIFVRSRILHETGGDIIRDMEKTQEAVVNTSESDISDRLELFDKAFKRTRKPGRPRKLGRRVQAPQPQR